MIEKLITCPFCGSADVYKSETGIEVNVRMPGSSGPIVYKPKRIIIGKNKAIGVLPIPDKYYCNKCKRYFGE